MKKKIAFGYSRVSTQDQEENGVSLLDQKEKIENWSKQNKYELMNIFQEARSGSTIKKRLEFLKAIDAAIEATKNDDTEEVAFVVTKLDRFARSTKDAHNIIEKLISEGVNFISIAERIDIDDPYGEMQFTMMAGYATLERKLISKRTREALAYKKRMGERTGSIPYGFSVAACQKQLIKNDLEQEIISIMIDLRMEGRTLIEICTELNSGQMLTRKGKPWVYQNIQKILSKFENHQKAG